MEKSSYNGVSYKETYGYDSFKEYLETLTAYENDTQKAQNTMVYDEGELSTVSDGKAQYKFDYDKATDTSTFGIYQGATLKTLEKQVLNASENTVTHTYYRNDSSTPTDTFVYTTDKYGKPVSISYNGEQKVTYNYTEGSESEAVWLLVSVEDTFCGRTYAYTYNADGSQKSVDFGGFKVTKVNESEKEYEIGTSNPTKLKQTVMGGTHICKIANSVNGAPAPFLDRSYEYDGFGRTKKKRIKDPTNVQEDTDTAISKTELGYSNDHMLPTSETYSRNNTTVYTATYAYDGRGNIRSITDSHGTRTYTYDTLNRLTKETTTGSTILTNGNKSYAYDSNGRMTNFNGQAMTYDNRGRLTKIGDTNLTYDNYGNRLTKGDFVYTWTRGRLLASVNSTTYTYDKNGVRTKKIVNGVTHEYFYDGNKLIAEKVGDKYFYFFYDESGVCGFRYENIDYEYVKNIFGDVIGIYNEYGTHVATYAYDAWGNMTYCNAGTDVAYINPFLYRGYYYDSESGLYYLMSRYYDPSVGQFISPDTQDYLKPEAIGGVDLYAYCGNNPVMYVDPSGHDWWHWAIGAAIVVGLVVATCVTAGGALAGMAALSAATIGAQAVGATALTTTLAFATVGAGVAYTACAGVAAISSIETLANGGTFEDGLDTFAEAGENALYMTASAGIANGAIGYFSYIETGIKTPGKLRPFGTYYNCKGETLTHYGADGKMSWSKHFTDHNTPKQHPYVPHWHAEGPHYPPRGFKNVGELIKELIERFFGGGHTK